MKNHQIKIANPCHEDWGKMSKNDLGRHCLLCDKTVVDFTKMSSEEIRDYLSKKGKERICGRIMKPAAKITPSKKQQWFNGMYLKINDRVGFKPMRVSLLTCISLLMVVFGCHHNTAEIKPSVKETKPIEASDSIANDSVDIKDDCHTIGQLPSPPDPIQNKGPHHLKGEVEVPRIEEIGVVEDPNIEKIGEVNIGEKPVQPFLNGIIAIKDDFHTP
jgi:hypothetical protein